LKKRKLVLKLFLLSDPKLLCVVRATVSEMAMGVGFSASQVRSIVLATDEAITNVMRHAYQSSPDRPIQIAFYRGHSHTPDDGGESLEIRIVDHGTPLDPQRLVGRHLDEVRPGGLGLHFIREIMDSVTYRHVGGRNSLRLIKSLTPAVPNHPEKETI
jgi:serine/threonine-protein kinase RsbW